jgi:hypothetical protein
MEINTIKAPPNTPNTTRPSSPNNKDNLISILFILDSSGSMQVLRNQPIQSMRAFYNVQKQTGKEFLSTFITFNDSVNFIHKNMKGSEIIIKNEHYIPAGMTALLDAIGTGIEFQRNIKSKNVICVILTDGHENASKIYKISEIKALTKKMETENGWKFVYLGANQDSFDVSESLGINPNNSSNYDYTPKGIRDAIEEVGVCVSGCITSNNLENLSIKSVNV